MAIPEIVQLALGLTRLTVPLSRGEQPWRVLCASPEVISFVRRVAAEDPPGRWDADLTPREQIAGLFRRFIVGAELFLGTEFHIMRPDKDAIWELKTPDFRFFGWFTAIDEFVMLRVDWADRIKEHGLYEGYREEVVLLRAESGADRTACVWSVDHDAVISVRDR